MDLLVIPVYKRAEYLETTLWTVQGALDKNVTVILADDGSADKVVTRVCQNFIRRVESRVLLWQFANVGVAKNMLRGIEGALKMFVPERIITLDSDFIVKPEFFEKLRGCIAISATVNTVVTGFNATSHPVIESHGWYAEKKSIGGGNLCFTTATYLKHIRPALTNNMWDWTMVGSVKRAGGKFLCTIPSVAQHIGKDSLLGHPNADYAIDYDDADNVKCNAIR